MISKESTLIFILTDDSVSLDVRDDAAIELGNYHSDIVISTLIKIASNPKQDEILRATCGESIADIWLRLETYDYNVWASLTKIAQNEISGLFRHSQPEWINEQGQLKRKD